MWQSKKTIWGMKDLSKSNVSENSKVVMDDFLQKELHGGNAM